MSTAILACYIWVQYIYLDLSHAPADAEVLTLIEYYFQIHIRIPIPIPDSDSKPKVSKTSFRYHYFIFTFKVKHGAWPESREKVIFVSSEQIVGPADKEYPVVKYPKSEWGILKDSPTPRRSPPPFREPLEKGSLMAWNVEASSWDSPPQNSPLCSAAYHYIIIQIKTQKATKSPFERIKINYEFWFVDLLFSIILSIRYFL
jgi:hypothetical protein